MRGEGDFGRARRGDIIDARGGVETGLTRVVAGLVAVDTREGLDLDGRQSDGAASGVDDADRYLDTRDALLNEGYVAVGVGKHHRAPQLVVGVDKAHSLC